MRKFRPEVEPCESRLHPTMVFLFPGNALAAASPDVQTRTAAARLAQLGNRPIQVATPALNGPGAFHAIANYVRKVSHGRPIGLVGFSAGGALAMRLASQPGLNVKSVLNYYGPPDLKDWFAAHRHDHYYQYVTSHVHVTGAVLNLMSGPSTSNAYFVGAFGLHDANVKPTVSTASFHKDFPNGQVFHYLGPHGVTLYADYRAFQTFLNHL